jgi:ABC-type transport system involved in multi-copper enzyme maturation permease subunit
VAAFMATYLLGIVMCFGMPFIDSVFHGFSAWIHRFLSLMIGRNNFLGLQPYEFNRIFVDPTSMLDARTQARGYFWLHVLRSVPMLMAIISMLYLARFFIVRRAFAQPKNILLSVFRFVDRLFVKANDRFGGVVLSSGNTGLPGSNPIQWRETTKKTLGTSRYLVRILVALEFPVAFICAISVANINRPTGPLSVLLGFVWVIAVLLISVSSACLIATERSHQTLEVLMTTPLSNREILRQKFVGVRRLMLVLAVPFMTIYVFEAWLKFSIPSLSRGGFEAYDSHHMSVIVYFISSIVTTALYFHMFAVISMLVGLKIRSQAKAIFASLGLIVGWCVLPFMLILPILNSSIDRAMKNILLLMSPVSMIAQVEFHEFKAPLFGLFMNCLIYGTITAVAHSYLFYQPNGMLGRIDSNDVNAAAEPDLDAVQPANL